MPTFISKGTHYWTRQWETEFCYNLLKSMIVVLLIDWTDPYKTIYYLRSVWYSDNFIVLNISSTAEEHQFTIYRPPCIGLGKGQNWCAHEWVLKKCVSNQKNLSSTTTMQGSGSKTGQNWGMQGRLVVFPCMVICSKSINSADAAFGANSCFRDMKLSMKTVC